MMLVSILFAFLTSIFSQEWNVTKLSVHDGLAAPSVTKIIQSSDGYLYFGTQLGVDRYDGLQVIHISIPESNPDLLSIRDLGEDCLGKIWILSDAGICKLNSGEFSAKQQHYMKDQVPIRMVRSSDGEYFYFVLKDASLHRINARSDSEEIITTGVKFLCSDQKERLIYTDSEGNLNIYNIPHETTNRIKITNPSTLANQGIPLLEDRQPDWRYALRLRVTGNLLFMDMGEFCAIVDLQSLSVRTKPYSRMYDVVTLPDGEIFVAADGISILDGELNDKYTYDNKGSNQFDDNYANTTCLDREGGIWVGTRNSGVFHFSNNYSGLSIIDFYQTLGLKGANTRGFHSTADGTIDIETSGAGTIQIVDNGEKLKISRSRNNLTHAANCTNKDTLRYFLQREKLYERQIDTTILIDTPSDRNKCFLTDYENGILWLASATAGLWKMNISDNSFERISIFGDESNYSVNALAYDSKGYLWGATDRSVFRLDPKDNSIRSFSKKDGFPTSGYTNAVSYLDDGRIYIGMLNGYLSFNPDLTPKTVSSNKIVFVDIQRLGSEEARQFPKEPVIGNSITLPFKSNSFSIGVSDLSFAMPSVSGLQYRIAGIADNWTDVDNGRIVIANLPAGKHTLEVRQDPSYPVHGAVATLNIRILSHPLLSTWAFITYFLLISGMIALAVLYTRKREREKAQIEDERRAAKNAKDMYVSKVGFLSNVVQGIGTPLTIIKSISDSLERQFSKSPDLSLYSDIQFMSHSIDNISSMINDFAGISSLGNLSGKKNIVEYNLNGIIRSIYRNYTLVAKQKGLTSNLALPPTHILASVDKVMLERILTQILSNAVKYASTYFNVYLEVEDDTIKIITENDGEIIPTEFREQIFEPFYQIASRPAKQETISGLGLHISRSLAEELGGSLKMDTDMTVNRFILSLPYTHISSIIDSTNIGLANQPTMKPLMMIADSSSDFIKYIYNHINDTLAIVSFTDGKSVLDYMNIEENRIPDIILSDVFLPEINGFDVCKSVKTTQRLCQIPVILTSSGDIESSQILANKNGADLLLMKPFSMEHLFSSIKNLLEGRERLKDHYRSSAIIYPDKVTSTSGAMLLTELDEFLSKNIKIVGLSVDDMAAAVNMSSSNLQKRLKAIANMSPIEYLNNFKMNRAVTLLENDTLSILEISEAIGYDSQTYFTKVFKKHFNTTPSNYRKKIIRK